MHTNAPSPQCFANRASGVVRAWSGATAGLANKAPQRSTPGRRWAAIKAYQEGPSSPWPRQQPQQQQQPHAPAGSAASATPAAGPHGSSSSGAGAASATAAAATASGGSSSSSSSQRHVQAYRGLSAAQFQHPLDQQNTALLRALPGLELIARNLLAPAAEQVLLLENIATSVRVGPDQLPTLHHLLTEAAAILQMEAPDLYVRQNPVPNAYTLAIAGQRPFIVVHTALLELLTPAEVQAVLAHELGHLKCDHGVWLTAANVLALGTVSLLPVVSSAVEEGLLRWLRAAELTCDRAALLVAQDSKVVISALMKLAGGCPSFANELNIDAFLRQARSYDEATSSPIGWYLRNAQTKALSHPLPVMRAREIDRWSQSQQYLGLLAANQSQGPANSTSSGNGSGSSAQSQRQQQEGGGVRRIKVQ